MAITTADSVNTEAVARAERRNGLAWVWQVTILSLLLGVMLALALRTELRLRPVVGRFGTRAGVAVGLKQSNERLQEEVIHLRQKVSAFEEQLGNKSSAAQMLAGELQDVKLRAGLVPMGGPGLIITLRDSPLQLPEEAVKTNQGIIHDTDINALLSELKVAGAESLGISGADAKQIQRVIDRTTARCIGPGMEVNDTRMGAPYHLYAIGNPKELRAQLEMPHGVIKELRLDILQMITIQESPKIRIPAYSGSYSVKYAKPTDTPR
jgi:uncharacterized protein YlxW (UPF0749 family)